MMNPVVKAFLITISALILLIFTLFYFRHVGLNRQHSPLKATFLKPGVKFYHGGISDNYPTHSLQALQLAQDQGAMNMISIQRTKDGHFVLFPDEVLDELTETKGLVFLMTLEELKKLKLKIKAPEKLLKL
jgi:hypothetical protein